MRRAGIVAPSSLVGRELRERLAARPALFSDVRLLSDNPDEIGQLAEGAGAATFVAPLGDDAFDGLDLVFFCGAIEADRPWIERLPARTLALVLSAGAASRDGSARIAGLAGGSLDGGVLLSPHPAAVGIALLLARLAPLGIQAAQAVALLPVSLRGQAALDELFEQTRGLLAFKVPKSSGGRAQTAFNVSLAAVDGDDLARQTLAALGAGFPLAVQAVDAGVFHGIGLALHVELAAPADLREVRRRLSEDARIKLARRPATVSPVALAGGERLVVGEIRAGATPSRLVLWAAFDNFTLGAAHAAVDLAEEMLGGAPSA